MSEELEAYKLRVRTVAKVLAKRHGWCTVVDEALESIDADGELEIDLDSVVEDAERDSFDRGMEAAYEEMSRPDIQTLASFERCLSDLQMAVDPFYHHTEKPAELVARLSELWDALSTQADFEETGR